LVCSCANRAYSLDEIAALFAARRKRTMAQVFDLAEELDARVILRGDRRQHGSVERGAARTTTRRSSMPSVSPMIGSLQWSWWLSAFDFGVRHQQPHLGIVPK
jgi:hypothetical protein